MKHRLGVFIPESKTNQWSENINSKWRFQETKSRAMHSVLKATPYSNIFRKPQLTMKKVYRNDKKTNCVAKRQ